MNKKNLLKLYRLNAIGLFCATMAAPLPLIAQTTSENTEETNEAQTLDEIVVTGRKREESLKDIPVSISVLSASSLADQNVLDQGDLADLVPGLFYNQGNGNSAFDDRIAALPSIRGISSSEIATNRTKVSSFVDGMPIIGSVGAINIGGATQVEVYSGPQSAAFGRSTFAGAINYVTADPGDELAGSVGVNWSDQGTRILSGSVGGPISETLGFQLGGSYEDSVSPDSDVFTYSDGIEAETRGGVNFSGRLVWTPQDNFSTKLTFAHDETDDGPSATFYATQQSSLNCFNSLNTFLLDDGMGPAGLGVDGEFDCDFDVDSSSPLQAVNNITRYYDENPDALAALVQTAIDNGATDGEFGDYTVEEAIRLIGEAYSVPYEDVGSQTERDRVSAQFDYYLDDGSGIQLSLMKSEEEYIRQSVGLNSATPVNVEYVPASAGGVVVGPPGSPPSEASPAAYSYDAGMDVAQSDPTTIDETYAELRWASPSDQRTRFVVGASYYEYEFITSVYADGGYNAVTTGIVDDVFALTGVLVEPAVTLSEATENTAFFFNTSYDFTDKITGSIEGRYSSDKVGGLLPEEGIEQYQTTNTFTPRIALNYSPNDNTTYYIQYAIGVNPGGINADLLDPDAVALLDNGVPVDLDPNDPNNELVNLISVNYDSSDYVGFDEETLTNYEFGFKGSAFDNRLSYTGALYFMIWEDAVQPFDLDWDYTYADDDLEDTLVPGITPDTYYVGTTDDTSARVFANSGTSETMGIELQASYQIDDNWSISGNTSLMQAEYTDYCSEEIFTGNDNDLGDYANLVESTTDLGNPCYVLDGKKLAQQPSFTLSLSPSYRAELSNGMNFSASSRIQYQSSQYNDVANISESPETTTVNLTFGLSKDAWSGTFYIENLLDDTTSTRGNLVEATRYLESYPDADLDEDSYFSGASANEYSHYGIDYPSGRTLGVRLNYNF